MNVNNIISKQKSYEIIKSRDGTFLSELVKNSFIVYCVRGCTVNKLSTIFRESSKKIREGASIIDTQL